MEKTIIHITEANKHFFSKPNNSDLIYFSNLLETYTHNAFRCFSIKYPWQIKARYIMQGKVIELKSSEYFIAAENKSAEGFFRHREPQMGICIDISKRTLAEVYSTLVSGLKGNFDNLLASHFEYPNFPDHLCNIKTTLCGPHLQNLATRLVSDKENFQVSKEWFYQLAEKIILQESETLYFMKGLTGIRSSTRKEILHRLYIGRNFIDECFLANPSVSAVAKTANLSLYHFLRCFKQAFGTTPKRYIELKRLDYAWDLLRNHKELNVSEIAHKSGFADLPSFSKAFSKRYKTQPSVIRKGKIQ